MKPKQKKAEQKKAEQEPEPKPQRRRSLRQVIMKSEQNNKIKRRYK
jgi:hypothetical protein